jgi:hypothetical protein
MGRVITQVMMEMSRRPANSSGIGRAGVMSNAASGYAIWYAAIESSKERCPSL